MSSVPGAFAKPSRCACYAALAAGGPLVHHTITRRGCAVDDVVIDIKYAGICHSDIHQVAEEWGKATFPMVPGHEIGGVVVAVGSDVTKFKVGQTVGVGCMVDSCRKCDECKAGFEQYCANACVWTYNDKARYPHMVEHQEGAEEQAVQYGGYSRRIVCTESFVVSIPTNLDLAGATPLLCAGITTYSPFMHYGVRPNTRVGVVGLGGLGHMAAKFGIAFGCHTTVISRGTGKKDSALNDLKVHAFVNSTDPEEMKAAKGTFDFILNSVAADHDIMAYTNLLATGGTMCMVGVPPTPLSLRTGALIGGRKTVGGSLIGGIKETQEMLDFCGRHNITCDIELIDAGRIDEAYRRTVASDVKYRFVIDTATIAEDA